jgi:hypothetical protein
MRMLIKVSMDVEKGNETIKNGSLFELLPKVMEELKPEAAYFTAMDGTRTALIVADIAEPAGIPPALEPFWLALNAKVSIYPVMSAEDLMKAQPGVEAAAQKYG